MLMAYGVKEMRGIDRNEAARERLADHGGTVIDSLEELMATCDIIVATTGVAGSLNRKWYGKGKSSWLCPIQR